ncbi:MAG: CheR family methyltransferase [Nanoarchaeota archaeon]
MILAQDPENFDTLKRQISRLLSFSCENYTDTFLSRRIDTRLRAKNMNSYKDYAALLQSDPKEHDALDRELTIHVTHFFRDRSMWDAFQEKIIPYLVDSKLSKHQTGIRVWSAGCSTGEESYSIVICFMEALGDRFSEISLRVIGTDYDAATVELAKKGSYAEQQLREMDEACISRYFTKTTESYDIKQELKRYVTFERGDVLSSSRPKNVDVIFCRNTVIYFQTEIKTRLYLDFYEMLNDNGFFIMGKTETLQGEARTLFNPYDPLERVFRK